ncbi:aminotransferase class V-fold PLP-dependent enzyme [Frigidibacter albus]|uniref:Aminotransferase class V-fold PLP-dependent enzyme n=2 Tax=Frigidibacter albus TaxID=1465486 RepID=A0A6L8VIA3_9RHOB|nr:aminotransferase class V-fold PLP-dependent enzyme [Frigidibacter albus]MZQ89272.1 aminotransferase class V-fold PLP-dependent enzyme [Frigidibacter albus]NBE31178.1 aminotransferase class V-fold PLP-dependent enzyme [Frigidibacter albus]
MMSAIDPAPIPDDPPRICAELFPELRDRVYLDTGSAGLSPVGMGRAAAQFYDEAKATGYRGQAAWQAKAAKVRGDLAVMLSVDPAEIEFLSGTTDALNFVSHSFPWQPGDEVVFAEDDFPSVRLAWLSAERAGAVLKPVPIPSEPERSAALIAAITPRTRLVATAQVQSVSGTRVDLDAIGRACHTQGALFVVDGIHALGATPVPLDHVDVFAAGVFKWMLAGFGLSVCILRPRARALLQPAYRGYLNQSEGDGFQFAHVNYPGLYALEASMEVMGGIGWDLVHRRTLALVGWLADGLQDLGIELLAPPGQRAGVATLAVPESERVVQALAAHSIHVARKGPLLRATPFFYNSREDVAQFVHALKGEIR